MNRIIRIRNEKESDYEKVEDITRKAFGIYISRDVLNTI